MKNFGLVSGTTILQSLMQCGVGKEMQLPTLTQTGRQASQGEIVLKGSVPLWILMGYGGTTGASGTTTTGLFVKRMPLLLQVCVNN